MIIPGMKRLQIYRKTGNYGSGIGTMVRRGKDIYKKGNKVYRKGKNFLKTIGNMFGYDTDAIENKVKGIVKDKANDIVGNVLSKTVEGVSKVPGVGQYANKNSDLISGVSKQFINKLVDGAAYRKRGSGMKLL